MDGHARIAPSLPMARLSQPKMPEYRHEIGYHVSFIIDRYQPLDYCNALLSGTADVYR